MRKFMKILAETILLALGVFAIMAISVTWPFILAAMGG